MIWFLNILIILLIIESVIYLKIKKIIFQIYEYSKCLFQIFINNDLDLELKKKEILENLRKLFKIYIKFFANIFLILILIFLLKAIFGYELNLIILKFLEIKFLIISILLLFIYSKIRSIIIEKF